MTTNVKFVDSQPINRVNVNVLFTLYFTSQKLLVGQGFEMKKSVLIISIVGTRSNILK